MRIKEKDKSEMMEIDVCAAILLCPISGKLSKNRRFRVELNLKVDDHVIKKCEASREPNSASRVPSLLPLVSLERSEVHAK